MVYLASPGYNQWNTASVSSCRIGVPQGTILDMNIYDFLSNASNEDCTARLVVTNDRTTTIYTWCAQAPWIQSRSKYDATESGQIVDILMQQTDLNVVSKLLVLLKVHVIRGKNSFSFICFALIICWADVACKKTGMGPYWRLSMKPGKLHWDRLSHKQRDSVSFAYVIPRLHI